MKPLIDLFVAGSLVGVAAQPLVADLKQVPPAPPIEQIACHDENWQKQNLLELENNKIEKKWHPHIKNLLNDGRTQGYPLTFNSAYRTCPQQAELRKLACGDGDYNLNTRPSEECSPPTEPAGKSLHNEGLAVDIKCTGFSVFESSPCYGWLMQNGYKYYLINRPREPWHWSTTGH